MGNVLIGYVMIGWFRLEGEPAEGRNPREARAGTFSLLLSRNLKLQLAARQASPELVK